MMHAIRSLIHITLTIKHIKTYRNLTWHRSEPGEIHITRIKVFAYRHMDYTRNYPDVGINARPVHGKVHIINSRVALMSRIGIGGEVYVVTYFRICRIWTDPHASRFYMRGYHKFDYTESNRENRYCSHYRKEETLSI